MDDLTRPRTNSESTPAAASNKCCAPLLERKPMDASKSSRPPYHVDPSSELDLVVLPGEQFLMGTDNELAFADDGEGPVRQVEVSPFSIDRHTVTNARFAKFVEATGYCTEAENFEWSFVFWSQIPGEWYAATVVDTVAEAPWWCKVPGAQWRYPAGPRSSITGRENHPVVHVSWNDASAFCEWSGERLPTEAEWEYAARGGLVQKIYPWGDKLRPNGEHRCNIWQGEFPRWDTGEDGFTDTSPTDAFPPNGYGIFSMTGNTWEWCADWFSKDYHLSGRHLNPTGPEGGTRKVMKGGSFLCHKSYCNRYRVAARSCNTPDSTSSHMSFRCVKDV